MTAAQISIEQASIAARAADEKLGANIAVIDVSNVMAITDIFVVVSAETERQVASIVEEVETELTAAGLEPKRREGNREFRWITATLWCTGSVRRSVRATAWIVCTRTAR